MSRHHHPGGKGRLVLASGFAAILLLMTLLTLKGLAEMGVVNDQLQQIVHQHNAKAALVKSMRMSARERVFTLQHMLLLDDPFEQDEEALAIDAFGAQFSVAREELLGYPLNDHERFLLDTQGEYAQRAVPVQREVVQLIIDDRTEEARLRLINEVLPLQQKVLAALEQLEAQQEMHIEQATNTALERQQQARIELPLLGGMAASLGVLIAFITIRRNNRIERSLHHEKERAEVTLHSIGDGVITTAADGSIEYMNPAAELLTGWRKEEAQSRPLLQVLRLVSHDSGTPLVQTFPELLLLHPGTQEHSLMPHSDLLDRSGTATAVEFTASAIHDNSEELRGLVVTFRDTSQVHALAATLSHQARHDPLTNLMNRREFESRLEHSLLNARQENQQHALCFLDLDRFKTVNDSCGHAAGDELLKQLVGQLKSRIRSNDLLARLGGDEFGLLLENCPQHKAMLIAEDIRNAVNSFVFVWEKQSFSVGVSIGMVTVGPDSGTLSEVIAQADAACYSAKDGGRDRIHVYNRQFDQQQADRQQPWAERLQDALRHDRFNLYCQSIAAVNPMQKEKRLCELQLRFCDEQGQQIPPMAFIPAAERHNLMPAIDRWVLRQACSIIAVIDNPDAVYCINLSLQTISDADFIEAVAQQIDTHGIKAGQLCFEIAETHALNDLGKIRDFAQALKAMGCYSALDDVGRSIGSYDYLKGLPVDFIKIDGHLIAELMNNPISGVQIKAITQIAHLLGICVIAEKVEDHKTLNYLGSIGINYAQGFGVAKPRPVAEMKQALREATSR